MGWWWEEEQEQKPGRNGGAGGFIERAGWRRCVHNLPPPARGGEMGRAYALETRCAARLSR